MSGRSAVSAIHLALVFLSTLAVAFGQPQQPPPASTPGLDESAVHDHRGTALYHQGDLDGAIAEYRKALAIKPDDADARKNLDDALKRKGR